MAVDRVIGSLQVNVAVASERAAQNLNSFRGKVDSFAGKINRSIGSIQNAFHKITTSKVITNMTGQIRELAEMGPEEMEQLQARFSHLGITIGDGLGNGIEQMKKMSEQAKELSETLDTLQKALVLKATPILQPALEGIAAMLHDTHGVAKFLASQGLLTNPLMAAYYNRQGRRREGVDMFSKERVRSRAAAEAAELRGMSLMPGQKVLENASQAVAEKLQDLTRVTQDAIGASSRFEMIEKDIEKPGPFATMTPQPPPSRIVDANTREGFLALRSSQSLDATKKLEKQNDEQTTILKGIRTATEGVSTAIAGQDVLSIPGGGG